MQLSRFAKLKAAEIYPRRESTKCFLAMKHKCNKVLLLQLLLTTIRLLSERLGNVRAQVNIQKKILSWHKNVLKPTASLARQELHVSETEKS